MEELLVLFDLAKLAFDKGFDGSTLAFYHIESKQLSNDRLGKLGSYECYSRYPQWCDEKEVIAAPTHSHIQAWLREEYNILINIFPGHADQERFGFYYGRVHSLTQKYLIVNGKYSGSCMDNYEVIPEKDLTYEEALELSLHEALKLIKL